MALAKKHGLEAERTWSNAQSSDETERRCDVLVDGRPAQVKVAANGFKTLYEALDGVEMAFLRSDRREWVAIIPANRFLKLLGEKGAGGKEGERG